jgi:hypothetical protein
MKRAFLPIAALAAVLAHGQAVVAPQEDVSSQEPQAAAIAPAPELGGTSVWFAGAALTHEDPRYLRSGRNGFLPRLVDALEVGMLSRRDNGSVGFAYARTVAGLGTEMFEGVVFPDERAFTTGAIVTAAVRYVILREAQSVGREFLPDLLKGDASRAVRNLGLPLTATVLPRTAALPNASALLPPQP